MGEFRDDARNILGLEVDYVKDQQDAAQAQSFYDTPQIMLSNYERILNGNFDTSYFGGVSFDEGDAIQNLDTKT